MIYNMFPVNVPNGQASDMFLTIILLRRHNDSIKTRKHSGKNGSSNNKKKIDLIYRLWLDDVSSDALPTRCSLVVDYGWTMFLQLPCQPAVHW